MIIKLLPVDIPRVWEVIKVATCAANEVEESSKQMYLNNLLQDLLNETSHCFVKIENNTIDALAIAKISVDTVTQKKFLEVQTLYSWSAQDNSVWLEGAELIKNFANSAGCSYINCQSNNPAVWKILRVVGLEEVTRIFALSLGGK